MRVRTFLIVIVLGLFVGAIAGAIWRPRSEETGRVQKARYDEFDYTLAKSPKPEAYNIRLKAKAVSAGARARLLLDHQDQSNYYYVELTDQSVQIGRAEAGIEHALSRAVPPGLPRNRAADIVVKKRRTGIAVVIDGRAVVRAEDDTFASGKIGFGALSVTESEAKTVELTDRIRRQRIGDLYFSDSGTDQSPGAVYFLRQTADVPQKVALSDGTVLEGESLGGPNGVFADRRGLYVATYGSGELFRVTPDGERLQLLFPSEMGLDGIVSLEERGFLFSSWGDSTVYWIHSDGTVSPLIENVEAPADIGYDAIRNRVLIPLFRANELMLLEVR